MSGLIAFTPGPWSLRATCSGHSIYGPTGKRVAYTYVTSGPFAREQAEADALLIVRAPELHAENAALIHDLERVMTRENCYLNALMLISAMRGNAATVAKRALYGDEPHQDPLLAQGIEAQRATTVQQGVVHESPVAATDAPDTGVSGLSHTGVDRG